MKELAAVALALVARAAVAIPAYEIDVTFDPAAASMSGRAVVHLDSPAPPAINFWLHGELRVSEVRIGSEKVPFEEEQVWCEEDYSLVATRVTVNAGARDLKQGLQIEWRGFFHPSAARSPSDYMRIDQGGVFLRGRGYSPWFPLFAAPGSEDSTADFRRVTVTVPAGFTPVFAGVRTGPSSWKAEALDLFAAQLTARPFELRHVGEVHVYSLADAASRAGAEEIMRTAADLLRIYRARYRAAGVAGQLHVVELPKFGDTSSANVVGVQEESWKHFADDEWAQRTLAHELVHPFVQTITPRSDPLYAMAIEGFPAYFQYPAMAASKGEGWYDATLRRIAKQYIDKKRTGKTPRGLALPPEKPLTALTGEDIGHYKDVFVLADRALLMMDDLRRRMGRERFDDFTRELFNRPTLDLAAFRTIVQKFLPGDGERLRTWLESTDYPEALQLH